MPVAGPVNVLVEAAFTLVGGYFTVMVTDGLKTVRNKLSMNTVKGRLVTD